MRFVRFQSSEERFLFLLHISIFITSIGLGIYIISNERLNVLGEVFGDFLNAISIAISYNLYGVKGFAGLEDVLKILKEIPSPSNYNFNSVDSYEIYQRIINNSLLKATTLQNPNTERLHGSINDISYTFYVIAAFLIFGIKIQSLSYLWVLLFFCSVFAFVISYWKSVDKLLLLWCLIVSIFLIVITIPGIGVQIQNVFNQRFLTVLGLIPLLHIFFSVNIFKTDIGLLTLIQVLLLSFVIFCRGLAQWMFVPLFLVIIYAILVTFFKNKKVENEKKQPLCSILLSGVKVPTLMLVIFLSVKIAIPRVINPIYQSSLWAHSHIFWYGIVISLTTDPILKNKYVCSEKPLKDKLKGLNHIQCEDIPSFQNRFINAIRNTPADMHAYHSAVRYLRDHGSDEQIGLEIQGDYFNVRWTRLDELMKIIFTKMIIQNPMDCLYMFLIVKPLRYFLEVIRYTIFFKDSIVNLLNIFYTLIFLILMFNLLLVYYYNKVYNSFNKKAISETFIKVAWVFPIIYVCSILPSIIFYCSPHTIVDSVTIFLSMLLSFPYFFINK
ncbi:hypothetical protein [Leptospira interrogans]|uniref:hypothetical protein n=1 Tax=Leptospira interrogans TaxID=173 RepID=UPI0002BD751B|nr:hypothetical protein [Leptospira interrogans]EMN07418.1 putative membrane protein [Leptospira interrogans serovar Muenchen str. Brem 129]